MNLINNPQSSRCPQAGDVYNLVDICPNINIDQVFNFLDDMINVHRQLPRSLQINSLEEMSHLIHTFVIPMYIDMEVFFNLPTGSIFNMENNDTTPFNLDINRQQRQVIVNSIANTFTRPDKGINLKDLLDSANINGKLN